MTDDLCIEPRVLRLEDEVAVSNARMAFVREVDEAVNAGRPPVTPPSSALASVTVNVVLPVAKSWSFTEFARHLDRVSFSLCFLGSEHIHIDDDPDVAFGEWVSWHPITLDGVAWLLAGRFRDVFHRVDKQWRLAHIYFTPEICCPWETGWGPERLLSGSRATSTRPSC